MEKFKKPFVIGMGVLVFLVAIVAALNMTSNTNQSIGKTKNNRMDAGFSSESMMNVGGSAKQLSNPMTESFSERRFPEMTADSAIPSMAPINTQVQKKEIKNGSLNLQVANADKTAENVSKIAKDNGGEVFSSNFYQTGKNVKNGSLEVRVPVANFEKTFSELKKVATLVVRESTSGQDVTLEYSDMQSQIKNKQAEEQSYLEILKQAGKISDVLEVTQQLAQTRGEIESLQGRIRFMESQTDMASISLSVTEDTTVALSDKWRPLQVAKDTINNLLKDMQGFVDFMIVLVIRVIPLIALYGIIVLAIYFIIKRIFFKNKV